MNKRIARISILLVMALTVPSISRAQDPISEFKHVQQLQAQGKVTDVEKKLKQDGKICFMLAQSYLRKPTPDFKKAEQYLEKARHAKSKLPDDMAMAGLNTVGLMAVTHPETVGWVHRIIMSSPSSYNMEPLRAARYADKYLNNAQRAATAANKALMGDDVTAGVDAARSANCLFSLLPDTSSVIADIDRINKHLGETAPFTDSSTEIRIDPSMNKKVQMAYEKLQSEHKLMEGYAVMGVANMALGLNSNRLGKAGYQIVVDRFPDLVNGDKPLGDTAKFLLAGLCRLTGDEAAAEKLADILPDAMGDKKNIIVVNKMSKMLKEKNWEGVLPVAEQVMDLYKANPTNKFYVSAQFATIAALYNLKRYDEVVTKAEELLTGGSLEATGMDTLKPAQAKEYNINSFFFLMDSHMKLGSTDLEHVDQALEVFARYQKRHPEFNLKLNKLAPNMYYNAVDCLSRMNANTEDEAAKAKNSAQAISYCKIIVEKWPDHALALSANQIITAANGETEYPASDADFPNNTPPTPIVQTPHTPPNSHSTNHEEEDNTEQNELKNLIESAEEGDSPAQCNLGSLYYEGKGVPQDYDKAAEWFEKAAEQGSAEDQYRLGLLYYKGQGVPQDYKKAADWFEKAAAQGWVAAEQMLERLHRNGQGGTKDY